MLGGDFKTQPAVPGGHCLEQLKPPGTAGQLPALQLSFETVPSCLSKHSTENEKENMLYETIFDFLITSSDIYKEYNKPYQCLILNIPHACLFTFVLFLLFQVIDRCVLSIIFVSR